jgi:hypothetical protein
MIVMPAAIVVATRMARLARDGSRFVCLASQRAITMVSTRDGVVLPDSISASICSERASRC